QWDNLDRFSEASTLPSFLYLPPDHELEQVAGKKSGLKGWIPGRFARAKTFETPGRVVHSAKSWLCHHAVDRSAPFLPWRSDEIPVEKRVSPIEALALLLGYLRAVWNDRFIAQQASFDEQEITVTVPASFDAAAQRLTLDAAAEAGYPDTVRLLEEPQAAFYYWLEQHRNEFWNSLPKGRALHVLVVDIGGGTTDFSVFQIWPQDLTSLPQIRRVAVGDHLLLGGDNMDLAIAHHLEPRLAKEGLSVTQWNYLAARCRDLKERCLTASSDEVFRVSIPSRGSSLLGGALSCQISRAEVGSIVLDGFFPRCSAKERPARTQAGLREWALPYAADSAVTRYLAEFLQSQPPIESILFNGGSLYPEQLRCRLQRQIAEWQNSAEPIVLQNPALDLAVALGAASFGAIVHHKVPRIKAAAARAIYLEVQKRGADKAKSLVCLLPANAEPEQDYRISQAGLELRVNRPVRFQAFYSTRNPTDKAGSLALWNDHDFHGLPPLQTTARITGRIPKDGKIPVSLTARINELGLLRIACVSSHPSIRESWPLQFDLRPHLPGDDRRADNAPNADRERPGIDPAKSELARNRITTLFSRPLDRRDSLTAANLLKSLEKIIELPKADWNLTLIRSLWPALSDSFSYRSKSIEHEEAFLILAGFLLRPGFGAEGDLGRIDELWRLHTAKLAFPGKRLQIQQYVLWRRVAGGLNSERQELVLTPEMLKIRSQKNLPAELVRMAGSFERIGVVQKTEIIQVFVQIARDLIAAKQYCAPYLVALGLMLSRIPFYAGPETVVSPIHVERAFEALSGFDWSSPELTDLPLLFLRAGRISDDPAIDLPKPLREKIVSKLEKSGLAAPKLKSLRTFLPVVGFERSSLFGESLPPGLTIG
ncbi:MAG: Hsp70 family protein, partial [Verrucomicrobia bacterium]|nr:Hsp70 family protein [Verrucomicrobiota bacterium]